MFSTLLLASAAMAHPTPPPPPSPPGVRSVREVVIIDGAKGEPMSLPAPGEGPRTIVIRRDGDPGATGHSETREIHVRRLGDAGGGRKGISVIDCEGGREFSTEAEGSKDGKAVKTRVRLCTKGGAGNPAAAIDGLERASKRIAEDKKLPDDVRAKVLASLGAEIARLKAAR